MQTAITILVAVLFGFAGRSFGGDGDVPPAFLMPLLFGFGLMLGGLGSLCYLGGQKVRAYIMLGTFTLIGLGLASQGTGDPTILMMLVGGGLIGGIGAVVMCDGLGTGNDDFE